MSPETASEHENMHCRAVASHASVRENRKTDH